MIDLLQLVLFDTDAARLDAVRKRIPNEPSIMFFEGDGIDVTARCHLDALFVTPMMAYEFGIEPILSVHEAHVLPMPQARQARGLPRILIAGVTLVPDKPYTSDYLGRVTVEALGRAVFSYNRTADRQIRRIGALPSVLGLEGANSDHAIDAVREVFRSHKPEYSRRTA